MCAGHGPAVLQGAAFGGAIVNALLAQANNSHCGVHKSKLLMYCDYQKGGAVDNARLVGGPIMARARCSNLSF